MMDRRLIGLASDPERLEALTLLNERSAGVAEVAAELEIEPAAAGRLLNGMYDDGLIEVVGEALNGGAMEPHYRAAVRVLWDDEDWAALGEDQQERLTAWVLDMIDSDIHEAIESGTYALRQDSHMSRSVSMVDEQGWDELRRIYRDALDAVLAVRDASAERLAEAGETGEAGFPVLSAMLCCELPPRQRGN